MTGHTAKVDEHNTAIIYLTANCEGYLDDAEGLRPFPAKLLRDEDGDWEMVLGHSTAPGGRWYLDPLGMRNLAAALVEASVLIEGLSFPEDDEEVDYEDF